MKKSTEIETLFVYVVIIFFVDATIFLELESFFFTLWL